MYGIFEGSILGAIKGILGVWTIPRVVNGVLA